MLLVLMGERLFQNINNLETLKDKFKPEGVTNEMIDEDIRLVNNIERLSNNKSLRNITDELGINNDDFISVVKMLYIFKIG